MRQLPQNHVGPFWCGRQIHEARFRPNADGHKVSEFGLLNRRSRLSGFRIEAGKAFLAAHHFLQDVGGMVFEVAEN